MNQCQSFLGVRTANIPGFTIPETACHILSQICTKLSWNLV